MKISDLNRKITFQNKNVEVDGIGNHKSVWMDYITTSAYISFQGKGEEVFLGMEVDLSLIHIFALPCAVYIFKRLINTANKT